MIMDDKTAGWLNGFLGVAIFSGSLPATRIAVHDLAPLFLTTARAAIAGLIGVAFAVAIMAGADYLLAEVATTTPFGPPNVALKTVLTAVGVLIVTGGLGGIMPAAHAASIRPIEALRTE